MQGVDIREDFDGCELKLWMYKKIAPGSRNLTNLEAGTPGHMG